MDKPTAFVIEDDSDIAELYAHMLQLLGFEVELFLEAETARASLTSTRPDVVILDLRLGRTTNGSDLLGEIRADPRLRDVTVFVVSGYPRLAEEVQTKADFVLVKPVDIRQLAGLVSRLRGQLAPAQGLRELFEHPVLDRNTFVDRLAFNLIRKQSHPDHLFALISIDPGLEAEPKPGGEAEENIRVLYHKVGHRIMQRLRLTDLVGRTQDNRFLVMLHAIQAPENAGRIAQRLLDALREPFTEGEQEARFRPKNAVVLSTEEVRSAEDMLSLALSKLQGGADPAFVGQAA